MNQNLWQVKHKTQVRSKKSFEEHFTRGKRVGVIFLKHRGKKSCHRVIRTGK